MHTELLEILRCPQTGQRLVLEQPEYRGERIHSGWLVSEDGEHCYAIRDFIPRFVPESNYADNFGMQWNKFRQTQLDSYSGHPISANRFWKATGWHSQEVAGQWVLDAGCGAGRFAEVTLSCGANLVALDYSSAVDACWKNLGPHPGLNVVQGNIYQLPFRPGIFDFVYCFGVLQHTPDVRTAFLSLPTLLRPGGQLAVDVYPKSWRSFLRAKFWLRPLTSRMEPGALFSLIEKSFPILWPLSRLIGRVPRFGRQLRSLLPIANYEGIYALSEHQLREWAILDTFDMLAPRFDSPQTKDTLWCWFAEAGFDDITVFRSLQLVGRGVWPTRAINA